MDSADKDEMKVRSLPCLCLRPLSRAIGALITTHVQVQASKKQTVEELMEEEFAQIIGHDSLKDQLRQFHKKVGPPFHSPLYTSCFWLSLHFLPPAILRRYLRNLSP
jgi:hypothetical protein